MLIPSSFNYSEKMMTRHIYLTRDNKQKIMIDVEQENATYTETLEQLQGQMNQFQGKVDTIMEYLRTKKEATTFVVVETQC